MLNSKVQEIKQSSYNDYIFDSWANTNETSRVQTNQQTQLKIQSQRQKKFKYSNILYQNNDQIITTKSQVHQKYQDVQLNSFSNNLDELKQKEQYSFQKYQKVRSTNRNHSICRNQNEDLEIKYESIANCSTIFSQRIKNSQKKQLSYSQNCKLILPKIKKKQTQKILINKFLVICRVIGKIIILYFKTLSNTNPLKITNNLKLQKVLNLRKIFKYDRNISDSLSKSIREWVKPSLQKIFYHLQNTLIYTQDEKVLDLRKLKDQEQIWTLNFAKFLFQNLELITRKGNIPKEIIKAMSNALYQENNQYVQLFLAQRTKFYNYPFSILEIQLICSEYILFNAIVIELFDQANNLTYQSFNHNLNCKIQVLKLTSIINVFYINIFKDMPIINFDYKDEQLYSRKLYITNDQQQLLQLVDTKEINNSETLILGLKHQDYIQRILQQKEKQKQKLELIFNKFINNLYSQIDISE
ncbi:unnamed protein product [Paramecium pentaurelia]|uniref:Uncharacterized protein n=1 Tax=Paramecium pentaurelia TaxID=43138 RepID=A0A8S1TX81_9CILI|nr:unnamed protein product [Paramecium pentaurelia]